MELVYYAVFLPAEDLGFVDEVACAALAAEVEGYHWVSAVLLYRDLFLL